MSSVIRNIAPFREARIIIGYIFLVLTALMVPRACPAADFKITSDDAGLVSGPLFEPAVQIVMDGEIFKGDANKLSSIIEKINSEGRYITLMRLKSIGGNFYEGLKIGRLVRKHRLATYASFDGSHNQSCASACAYVWLSGAHRIGGVSVHRSYLESDRFGEWEKAMPEARQALEKFLSELEVPASIINLIKSTPASEARLLTAKNDNLEFQPFIFDFLERKCGRFYKSGDWYDCAICEIKRLQFFAQVQGSIETYLARYDCRVGFFRPTAPASMLQQSAVEPSLPVISR
ncbi:hypothetical protein [Aquicoccus sp.]|uniref:hypothetical protein n=1 Tax=Aquicoccus sp. TaxID=2055851 RepID=UPI00356376E0